MSKSVPVIKVGPGGKDEGRRDADGDRTIVMKPHELPQGPAVSSLMAQYTMIEKIGDGGMGVVYLAKDNQLGRYVAIKRLKRDALTSDEMRRRFLHEAKSIATLNHIHIVHVYGLGEDRDGPYIIMEYVPGPPALSPGKSPPAPLSLADRVQKQGPFGLGEAADMGIKLCRAVEYAHHCGVIHRDIKPSNVLLDESGEPKVVDFGLARNLAAEMSHLTLPGEKMLSIGYGAPEQETDASTTDERADVYGLGALLYFSVTGQNPRYFRENSIPEALRPALMKALQPDRNKRFGTVSELRNALVMLRPPSTADVPTAQTTWRCKWCDAINPVMTQYCGECGWDGRDSCAECGAEMRFGLLFCGACGVNAREYETATRLLAQLTRWSQEKNYDMVVRQAGQISGFQPAKQGGKNLVERVRQLETEARKAIETKSRLERLIVQDMEGERYEDARTHIAQYRTLSSPDSYAEQVSSLPDLIARRDVKNVEDAVRRKRWREASRMCEAMQASGIHGPELDAARSKIRSQHVRVAVWWTVGSAWVLFGLYLSSMAPAYKIVDRNPGAGYLGFYALAAGVRDATWLGRGMDKYAGLWGVPNMHLRIGSSDIVPGDSGRRVVARADAIAEVQRMRAEYEKFLDKVESEYRDYTSKWPEDYQKELGNLRDRMRSDGDFDGWTVVSGEIQRFASERLLGPDNVASNLHALASIQRRVQEQVTGSDLERQKKILQTSNNYINGLSSLMRDLTKKNEMTRALAVSMEVKRVRQTQLFLNAEAAVAEARSQKNDNTGRK